MEILFITLAIIFVITVLTTSVMSEVKIIRAQAAQNSSMLDLEPVDKPAI